MIIHNRIDDVAKVMDGAKWTMRLPSQIDSLMVHRISISEMAENLAMPVPSIDSLGLARLSLMVPEIGRKLAYPILVLPGGEIEQGLPLIYISPHGRSSWNRRAIGIGVVGDFRDVEPTRWQIDALKWALPLLRSAYCPTSTVEHLDKTGRKHILPCVLAHGEAPDSHDGTKAPGRHNYCPGQHLDIQGLRAGCGSEIIWRARTELGEAGLRFDA